MAGGDGKGISGAVSEVVAVVRGYAVQETVGPLKAVLRWLALGLAGGLLLSLGVGLLLLSLLRVLQSETDVFQGNWSWVPYVITLVVGAVVVVLAGRTAGRGARR